MIYQDWIRMKDLLSYWIKCELNIHWMIEVNIDVWIRIGLRHMDWDLMENNKVNEVNSDTDMEMRNWKYLEQIINFDILI